MSNTPTLPKNDKRSSMDFSTRDRIETREHEAHTEIFIKGEYVGYAISASTSYDWWFCPPSNKFGAFSEKGKKPLMDRIKKLYNV